MSKLPGACQSPIDVCPDLARHKGTQSQSDPMIPQAETHWHVPPKVLLQQDMPTERSDKDSQEVDSSTNCKQGRIGPQDVGLELHEIYLTEYDIEDYDWQSPE